MNFFYTFKGRFKEVHGDTYDYSRALYKGALEKIEIVCPTHGSFWQLPVNHSKGVGCPECAKAKRKATRAANKAVLTPEERKARRKAAIAKYEAMPEVRQKAAERRAARRDSGESKRYQQAWYEKNKTSVLARVADWAKANQDKVKESKRKYRAGVWDKEKSHSRITQATPAWVDVTALDEIYAKCRELSELTGVPHHVDHIEPLRSPMVCGLHVPENLRIVPATENLAKGNGDTQTKREFWEGFSDAELDAYIDVLLAQYRTSGFPYYTVPTETQVSKSIVVSRKYLESQPIDAELVATTHGGAIATAFFPHLFDVRMGDKPSPMDVYHDDAAFKAALKRMLSRHDHVSDRTVRTALCLYGGARAVSNFPVMSAAKLYRRYAGENATVYDPCGGWGGRMLGAAVAPNVKNYICTEVSELSLAGLEQLASNCKGFLNSSVVGCCAEDFFPNVEVDMVFTSPPYFDHEKYSDDPNQSFIKYRTVEEWTHGFLEKIIKNARKFLRKGGVLALNVADVPTCPTLTSQTMRLALTAGFTYVDTHKLFVQTTNGGKRSKFEPVFVFTR